MTGRPRGAGWRAELRLVQVAIQFLTRVPVPALSHWDPRWLEACVRHFPLVGLGVGAVGGAVLWALQPLLGALLAALCAVAATAALTGAFHEDGLADTFDALGGSVSRERALEIMKDSRIGSYGALALGLVTALRVVAVASLAAADPAAAAVTLAWVHALARVAPVGLMVTLPYAGDAAHAKAKPLATQVHRSALTCALAWALGFAGAGLGAAALTLEPAGWLRLAVGLGGTVLAVGAVGLAMHRWLRQRLGGYTGDTLGATEQLAEAAALMAAVAALQAGLSAGPGL